MLGFSGAGSVVGVQIGYCISDIISKCGVGLLTYQIAKAKSKFGSTLGAGDGPRSRAPVATAGPSSSTIGFNFPSLLPQLSTTGGYRMGGPDGPQTDKRWLAAIV